SRIEAEFLQTDQRRWFCPCPKCGHYQTLKWEHVLWGTARVESARRWKQPVGDIATDGSDAVYECASCHAHLSDAERVRMVRAGQWRATAPFTGKRGYHLNGIASPFKAKKGFKNRLHQMVAGFLEAKAGGRETLKTWVNTFLAETFEDEANKVECAEVMKRCKDYLDADGKPSPDLVPEPVMFITAAVDVQHDRLELEFDGWGQYEESWALEYLVIPGDPLRPKVWAEADAALSRRFKTVDGRELTVAAACVDSGDPLTTDAAMAFTKPRFHRRIFAIKGSNQAWSPLVSGPYRGNRRRCPVYRIGTDTAKSIIYGRLKMEAGGPGYMHFPKGRGFDSLYFSGLTAEEIRISKKKSGFPERKWHKIRERNEPLDLRVYSLAAVAILNPRWSVLTRRYLKDRLERVAPVLTKHLANAEPAAKVPADEAETVSAEESEPFASPPPEPKPAPRRRARRGWMNSWKH
ncbi:MAG: terminase gpA endonuclease subunit, partial [Verrucomicrobiota bacterium]